jgi:origin recognition complex subunit 1
MSVGSLYPYAIPLTIRRAVEVALESTPPHPVTIREMQAVLALMSSSPVSLFLKQCSVQQKVVMAAVLRCVRREGIPEISWRSVSRSPRCCTVNANRKIRNDTDALTRSLLDSAELLSSAELALVLASLTASHAVTYQYDSTKALDDRKLALGMESGEVGRVLMNEGESWRRALAGT